MGTAFHWLICAVKYLPYLEEYILVLTYSFFSDDKTEPFVALLQGLEKHPYCCTTAKNL